MTSNISKRLIIKGLDNQTQVYKYVCLIIKSLDDQVQLKISIIKSTNTPQKA